MRKMGVILRISIIIIEIIVIYLWLSKLDIPRLLRHGSSEENGMDSECIYARCS